jgi:hypothetical protein
MTKLLTAPPNPLSASYSSPCSARGERGFCGVRMIWPLTWWPMRTGSLPTPPLTSMYGTKSWRTSEGTTEEPAQ